MSCLWLWIYIYIQDSVVLSELIRLINEES